MELTKSQELAVLIICMIILINLYKLYRLFTQSKIFYKTPFYNEALLGMYVKFQGTVVFLNQLKIPALEIECEFFKFNIKAFYQVKRESPSSGHRSISTIIYREKSEMFLIKDQTKAVYIHSSNHDENKNSIFMIREVGQSKTLSTQRFPNIYRNKYLKYLHQAKYLKNGDIVTVYGKLTKQNNKYVITDTFENKYPFIVALGDHLSFGSFYHIKFLDIGLSIFFTLILILNFNIISNESISHLLMVIGASLSYGLIKSLSLIMNLVKENYFFAFIMLIIVLSLIF